MLTKGENLNHYREMVNNASKADEKKNEEKGKLKKKKQKNFCHIATSQNFLRHAQDWRMFKFLKILI